MRWLVLVLVLANMGLFFWLSGAGQGNVRSVQEGRLPRVAEIQLLDPGSASVRSAPEPLPAASSPGHSTRPQPRESTVEGGENRGCYGVGWFREQDEALDHLHRLETEPLTPSFVRLAEQSEPLEDFHWVLIPPLPTREDALARYRELVNQDIEAYVLTSGERRNAISLGLFRSRTSAEEMLERRQAENIDATLVKFPRNRIRYALVFEGVADPALLDPGTASGQGEARLQLIEFSACEGVATAEKNP